MYRLYSCVALAILTASALRTSYWVDHDLAHPELYDNPYNDPCVYMSLVVLMVGTTSLWALYEVKKLIASHEKLELGRREAETIRRRNDVS